MIRLKDKLLLIQKEREAIKKEAENPYFNSKYFDINALLRQIKPLFDKYDLLLLQPLEEGEDGKLVLSTSIINPDTNEELRSSVPLPENIDPQKMGSIITYFRRYSLQSLLALEAEDDDGNSGSGKVKSKKATPTVDTEEPPFV